MESTPSGMDTTLSTFPIEEVDLMHPLYPTITMDLADLDLDTMTFPFDDEESATIWAFRDQLREPTVLDTGLHENNLTEEPTTVAPHATLTASEHSFDSTTCPSLTHDSASEREETIIRQYTPPTPVSHSPSLEPASFMLPAPADVNSRVYHQMPQNLTPESVEILTRHLQDEWTSLYHYFSSSALSPPAQTIVESRPVAYPTDATVMYYCPVHDNGYTPTPCRTEFDQPCPHIVVVTYILPAYPMPPSASQPPVSNKRTFEFVDPEIPENFVANPNNHGRWQYDRNGSRHYLNAPKTKRPRTN